MFKEIVKGLFDAGTGFVKDFSRRAIEENEIDKFEEEHFSTPDEIIRDYQKKLKRHFSKDFCEYIDSYINHIVSNDWENIVIPWKQPIEQVEYIKVNTHEQNALKQCSSIINATNPNEIGQNLSKQFESINTLHNRYEQFFNNVRKDGFEALINHYKLSSNHITALSYLSLNKCKDFKFELLSYGDKVKRVITKLYEESEKMNSTGIASLAGGIAGSLVGGRIGGRVASQGLKYLLSDYDSQVELFEKITRHWDSHIDRCDNTHKDLVKLTKSAYYTAFAGTSIAFAKNLSNVNFSVDWIDFETGQIELSPSPEITKKYNTVLNSFSKKIENLVSDENNWEYVLSLSYNFYHENKNLTGFKNAKYEITTNFKDFFLNNLGDDQSTDINSITIKISEMYLALYTKVWYDYLGNLFLSIINDIVNNRDFLYKANLYKKVLIEHWNLIEYFPNDFLLEYYSKNGTQYNLYTQFYQAMTLALITDDLDFENEVSELLTIKILKKNENSIDLSESEAIISSAIEAHINESKPDKNTTNFLIASPALMIGNFIDSKSISEEHMEVFIQQVSEKVDNTQSSFFMRKVAETISKESMKKKAITIFIVIILLIVLAKIFIF